MSTGLEQLSRHDLSQALCERVIPQVKEEAVPLVLAPLTVMHRGIFSVCSFPTGKKSVPAPAKNISVEAMQTPLLRATQQGRGSMTKSHWVEEGLNAARHPVLIYVLEGEAHFRIGITRQMAEMDEAKSGRCHSLGAAHQGGWSDL